VLLGNVAHGLGTPIEWDAAAMRVTNNKDAEALIQYQHLNGWRLRG
jgi:hypothetical protein